MKGPIETNEKNSVIESCNSCTYTVCHHSPDKPMYYKCQLTDKKIRLKDYCDKYEFEEYDD